MKDQTSSVLCGIAFVLAGPGPSPSDPPIQQPGHDPITMTGPASHGENSAFPARMLAPPASSAAALGRLLGVDIVFSSLLEIDTATGHGAVVAPVPPHVIGGLAYDPNHRILYGSTTSSSLLLRIDPDSGAITEIGPFGISLMHGLGYDSDQDVLYGITNQGSSGGQALWQIDVTTGTPTLVGRHSKAGLSGLAYDSASHVMYASEIFEQSLYTIDLGSGAVSLVGTFDSGYYVGVGLEFDATLGLLATDNKASPLVDDELFRIDTASAHATLVGPIHAGNVLGLAFEPVLGSEYCTANPNSTGAAADIAASGSPSSRVGSLHLVSAPVPDTISLFFHGSSQSLIPFGDGFLCTTGDLVRGSLVEPDGNLADYTYDNSDPQHSLGLFVGATRHFQHWFRDPAGAGSSFNTSNAISIAILP